MNSHAGSRFLRYSLRMMLVLVTACAVCLGVLVNWKAQRTTAIGWIDAQAGFWEDLPVDQGSEFGVSPPFLLSHVGAPGLKHACVVVADKKLVPTKQAELERLFPEADIFVCSPGTGYKGKHADLVKH